MGLEPSPESLESFGTPGVPARPIGTTGFSLGQQEAGSLCHFHPTFRHRVRN
jgi:hypothetical protein